MAWHGLGWRAVGFSEIEKFPSAVLAHRWPEVKNYGDMTKILENEELKNGAIDLLVAGCPCQSFSVAGLRKGLADPRGNLTLHLLKILDELRPRWLVYENVPGILSSWSDAPMGEADADDAGGDRDLFGGLVGRAGGVGGGDRHDVVEQTNDFDTFTSGLRELGYGLAWGILDAQYFGVPQRRARVFVVGYLGDWRPAAAALIDRACLSGDPPPRREKRAGTAGGAESGAPVCSETSHALLASANLKADPTAETYIAHTLRGEGLDASEDGTGRGIPLVPVPIQEVGKRCGARASARDGLGVGKEGDPMFTLQAGAQHGVLAFGGNDHGQDATEELSPTIRSGGKGGGAVGPAIFDMRGNGDGETCPTLTRSAAGDRPSDFAPMVFEPRFARNGRGAPDELVPPLKAESGETGKGDAAPVVFAQNSRSEVRLVGGDGQITGAVAAEPGAQQQNYIAGSVVRRLSIVECERLQSFPDNYTIVPWPAPPRESEDYRETVAYLVRHGYALAEAEALANTPDGHRYKALGNSMNVNVMRWIGERIDAVDKIVKKCKGGPQDGKEERRRIWP